MCFASLCYPGRRIWLYGCHYCNCILPLHGDLGSKMNTLLDTPRDASQLRPEERDAIRMLVAFVREGCPDGPSPPGFPNDRKEDFRRAALEYFSDPPDPANHFRIDVPSDEYIRTQARIYKRPSGAQVELDLFADGEMCDLTATFDLDRESVVFGGPTLYSIHVM